MSGENSHFFLDDVRPVWECGYVCSSKYFLLKNTLKCYFFYLKTFQKYKNKFNKNFLNLF